VIACGLSALPLAQVRADQHPGHERIDFTAYTLRHNELSIGLGSASFGVLDQVTIGTYVLPWFAFPVLRAPVASGWIKVRDWLSGPVTVALRGGLIYLDASELSEDLASGESGDVGFLAVPVELSASWRIRPTVSQSLQLNWVYARISGELPSETSLDVGLDGASRATSFSASSLTEFRVTEVLALTLRGTVLLAFSDISLRADYERNGTEVAARLNARPEWPDIVANVIPGVHFSWSNVNLHLGVGVGTNWLPYVALPTQRVTVVPDADFYVRF
jgi:hypothetical protein